LELSESDEIWNLHFGNVSGTCTDNSRWRYQLDATNTVTKCCYKSKGNFKQCFYNDQLPAKVCEVKRKDNEAEWLKKMKYLHDLPQLQITYFLIALFIIMVTQPPIKQTDLKQISLKSYPQFDFSWVFIFSPLWILSLLFWASLGTAWLTKRQFPHLLYRLDRGFFYRIIMKEVSRSATEHESGVRRNDPLSIFPTPGKS
jgi:hypothetical protein